MNHNIHHIGSLHGTFYTLSGIHKADKSYSFIFTLPVKILRLPKPPKLIKNTFYLNSALKRHSNKNWTHNLFSGNYSPPPQCICVTAVLYLTGHFLFTDPLHRMVTKQVPTQSSETYRLFWIIVTALQIFSPSLHAQKKDKNELKDYDKAPLKLISYR